MVVCGFLMEFSLKRGLQVHSSRCRLDDPLSIGDLLRLRSVAIVTIEGTDYFLDCFSREFRVVDCPRVVIPFDSLGGREMVDAVPDVFEVPAI